MRLVTLNSNNIYRKFTVANATVLMCLPKLAVSMVIAYHQVNKALSTSVYENTR